MRRDGGKKKKMVQYCMLFFPSEFGFYLPIYRSWITARRDEETCGLGDGSEIVEGFFFFFS